MNTYKIGVDIGNSSTKINLNLEKTIILENHKFTLANHLRDFAILPYDADSFEECIISVSSVIDEQTTQKIIRKISDSTMVRNKSIKHWTTPSILTNANVENINELSNFGSDRALQIYYISQMSQADDNLSKIICGCGSAFTVEVIQNNTVIESMILPGLAMQLDVLHKKAAQLPQILPEEIFKQLTNAPKFSTKYSISNGVINTYIGVINNLITRYNPSNIVLSGGYADTLKNFYNDNSKVVSIRNLESEALIKIVSKKTK